MNYGQQDAGQNRDDLRGRLAMSPTGRQLAIDGSFVAQGTSGDPTDEFLSPPENFVVLRNNSGTLEWWGFTRDTGWQHIS